jgi:2-polyprenyl-6-methoxyphenol hydroxylase-like FAD-dependent oxidoreductase
MAIKNNVLIVGAGPVGLMLGCNLQSMGINTIIIDKKSAPSLNSKALTINAASLKILHSMGLISEFLSHGQKVHDIYIHWKNKRLSHINYRRLSSPYNCFLSLPQPETERILERKYLNLGGNLERNVYLEGIAPSENHVTVKLCKNLYVSNEHYIYVVGCDGGKSTVRILLGKKFLGYDYGIYFKIIDVELDWSGEKEATHYFIQEDGFLIVIPLPHKRHRIVIKSNFTSLDITRQRNVMDYQILVDQ